MIDTRSSKKGTWVQAIRSLLFPIAIVLILRWAIVEPYRIPSGSMIPNLLVHDHILVNRLAYGLTIPFAKGHIWFWSQPKRGDIVVFRYPLEPEVFFIKRLIGLPGDEILIENDQIKINGELIPSEEASDRYRKTEEQFRWEKLGSTRFLTRRVSVGRWRDEVFTIQVPEGHYFFMGDNRDESSDSRVWGFVPQENLIGRAWMIWMSCSETLSSMPSMCDPAHMRWGRFFQTLTAGGG